MYNSNDDIDEKSIRTSDSSFYVFFIMQFLLVMGNMFADVKTGVLTMLFSFILFGAVAGRSSSIGLGLSRGRNVMFVMFAIIGVFYFAEIGNPNNVQAAWNASIPQYWIYPIILAIVVPTAIRDVKGIEVLLAIWAAFIIFAAMKGYWQKAHGFSARDRYFLYTLGGWRTHIIWSGIRYFSFFSDAANYGVHSALATVTLGISALYTKKAWLKVLLIVGALCGLYGMAISGTRAAMAVPFAGLALYVVLSKNVKGIVGGSLAFVLIFSFFYFTNIGSGNQYIRKMRSAFRPEKDASYIVRVENRANMKTLMAMHPTGYGIGLSKPERFSPRDYMPYPPDSWLISVWVETGIVGLALYLIVYGVLFAWCSWIILFKIMNKQLRGLLAAWLCMAAGFFISAYVNDVMQYPNSIPLYTAFGLCMAGPYIDKNMNPETGEAKAAEEKPKKKYRYYKNIEA
jgi:hypothetical protein